MGSEEDLAEQGTSSPAAGTSQAPQAAPLDASEDANCTICQGTINNEAYVSWCRHRFCFPCIQKWVRIKAECPNCRQPVRHIFHNVGGNNYVVHSIKGHKRKRSRRCPSEGRRHRSAGGQHSSSSSRNRGGGRSEAPERGQSRSPRQHHDGHRRAQHTRGYNSFRSRRRQRRRAWDAAHDEGRAPRPERDVLASSRSQHRQRAGRDSSRQRHATRGRSQRRSRSTRRRAGWEYSRDHRSRQRWWSRDRDRPHVWERQRSRSPRQGQEVHTGYPATTAHDSVTRWRRWRSRDRDDGRPPRPERDVPASSRRSQPHQQAGWDSSRRWHGTRGRSWCRSRSTRRQAQQERQRRRDWDEGRALSPEWEAPGPSRRARHQRGRCDSSRERRAARSRSRRRSRSRQRSRSRARRRAW